MNDYVIITDSTTDLTAQYALENKIHVMPLGFVDKNGIEYQGDLEYSDISVKNFYGRMRKGESFKTNQVNVQAYHEVLSRFALDGNDIIVISFSSGLSGSYNSACVAKNLVQENYPNVKITVIDSLCASLGEGLFVYHLVKAKNDGMLYDELVRYAETLKYQISHWFTVDDIDCLKRGGRLSTSKALVAKTLNIKPILYVSDEGKLVARGKKIGRKNALNSLVDKMIEIYDKNRNEVIFISHGDCIDDVLYVKERIIRLTGITKFFVNEIGPVIGSHAGPGVLAIFFISDKR